MERKGYLKMLSITIFTEIFYYAKHTVYIYIYIVELIYSTGPRLQIDKRFLLIHWMIPAIKSTWIDQTFNQKLDIGTFILSSTLHNHIYLIIVFKLVTYIPLFSLHNQMIVLQGHCEDRSVSGRRVFSTASTRALFRWRFELKRKEKILKLSK